MIDTSPLTTQWVILMKTAIYLMLTSGFMFGCAKTPAPGSFADDLNFLRSHLDVVVLSQGDARVVVAPALQGRVMTSSAAGDYGRSYGWINRELLASGKTLEHINAYGGEDRFWLGPEGGQFSIFFKPGVPFDLEHWYTPACIDTEPFELVEKSSVRAKFKRDISLTNYSGTQFQLQVNREVRLIPPATIWQNLAIDAVDGVKIVGYESVNTLTNSGQKAWQKETGLLSIWILGMFNPSPATTIVIPFHKDVESEPGPIVNDAYFGKVPDDRLKIGDGVLFFKGDGQYRSKIGLSPQRAKSVAGSYDEVQHLLTIVQYNKPEGVCDYVNSMWKIQDKPYAGDVVNSYNDGPPQPGAKPLGPFYELETSSPAAALQPGASLTHIHRTYHFEGRPNDLDIIARAILGVCIQDIADAF